jgi:hypothetical protein
MAAILRPPAEGEIETLSFTEMARKQV